MKFYEIFAFFLNFFEFFRKTYLFPKRARRFAPCLAHYCGFLVSHRLCRLTFLATEGAESTENLDTVLSH